MTEDPISNFDHANSVADKENEPVRCSANGLTDDNDNKVQSVKTALNELSEEQLTETAKMDGRTMSPGEDDKRDAAHATDTKSEPSPASGSRPASAASPQQVAFPPMNFPAAGYPFFSNPFMGPLVPGQPFPGTDMPVSFPQPASDVYMTAAATSPKPGDFTVESPQNAPTPAGPSVGSIPPGFPAMMPMPGLPGPATGPGGQPFNPYVYQEMLIRYFQAMMSQANVLPSAFPTAPAFAQQPHGQGPSQFVMSNSPDSEASLNPSSTWPASETSSSFTYSQGVQPDPSSGAMPQERPSTLRDFQERFYPSQPEEAKEPKEVEKLNHVQQRTEQGSSEETFSSESSPSLGIAQNRSSSVSSLDAPQQSSHKSENEVVFSFFRRFGWT